MDRGVLRRGIRRRRRGAGGPPRQAALAPVGGDGARGGARAGHGGGGGGRGGGRAGHGGGRRGGRGGRARNGGGGRGGRGRGGGGGRGPLQRQRRARPPVPPHLDDWLKNAKYGNPNGLTFQQLEAELDAFLASQPRIDHKELDIFTVARDQIDQAQEVVVLLIDARDKCRKICLIRMILLRMYIHGDYISPGAQYWRKILAQQGVELDDTLFELRRLHARHRPLPDTFLTQPSLLPKET